MIETKEDGLSVHPLAPSGVKVRNAALDFVKGALVMCMVVYHSLNYFYPKETALRYLHFLPSSFIFIAGFFVSSIYLLKYDPADSRLCWRLFRRGIKLLLVFVALNVTANAFFKSNYNQRQLGLDALRQQLVAIFVYGDGGAAVFDVLLPISYLLMLSGILVMGCRMSPRFLQIVSGSLVLLCLILAGTGRLTSNLELLSMGLLGTLAGFISMSKIERMANQPVLLVIAYLVYLGVISRWYPVYWVNMIGVGLTLAGFYSLGSRLEDRGCVPQAIHLLGKYSLLAYILQIGELQIVFRCLRGFSSDGVKLAIALVATTLVMWAIIKAVDWSRGKWDWFNQTYKFVFA